MLRFYTECKQYKCMEEYNTYWGPNGGKAYYSAAGLVYRPQRGCPDEYNAHGLQIRYPNLVRYLCTHDLNMVTIKDINKLVKAIIADWPGLAGLMRGRETGAVSTPQDERSGIMENGAKCKYNVESVGYPYKGMTGRVYFTKGHNNPYSIEHGAVIFVPDNDENGYYCSLDELDVVSTA